MLYYLVVDSQIIGWGHKEFLDQEAEKYPGSDVKPSKNEEDK